MAEESQPIVTIIICNMCLEVDRKQILIVPKQDPAFNKHVLKQYAKM